MKNKKKPKNKMNLQTNRNKCSNFSDRLEKRKYGDIKSKTSLHDMYSIFFFFFKLSHKTKQNDVKLKTNEQKEKKRKSKRGSISV